MNTRKLWSVALLCLAAAAPAWSQQTGSISGRVTSPDGDGMPGVTVTAAGDVLPQPKTTETGSDGSYRLPLLPPGNYTLTFSLEGMAPVTREAKVGLNANTPLDTTLAPEALAESINVVAEPTLVDATSSEFKAVVSNETIEALPVGQDYRDLQKLIPGVQYTESIIRGASAGGSGQDNVYLYDGVNVNLPLFGILSAEPSAHDIDEVSILKGGAKAVDFNRAAGFTMNSISKSGTNEFKGSASYQVQPSSLSEDQETPTAGFFEEDKDWAEFNLGGPIVRDQLFFYASYYRPTVGRDDVTNAYGAVPGYDKQRDEFFGRLSWQPTSNLLFHGSYRDSETDVAHEPIGNFSAASTSTGADSSLGLTIVEGSWVINSDSYASFKYSDFENLTSGQPDVLFDFSPDGTGGTPLNINDLAGQGRLTVPTPLAGQTAYNLFIQPYINQYGYNAGGVKVGGGFVGGGLEINAQDFYRTSYQGSYNLMLGSNVGHELHVGYQWYKDEEDLDRTSNGWGAITIPGGRITSSGKAVYFQANVLQTGVTGLPGGTAPVIHSEFESQNLELNDDIRWRNWTFTVGLVVSNDQLFGQGLREGGNNPSGFELCLTCKYKMYEVDWSDQIQPRLGATWGYSDQGTLFTSYARYNPAASSLPRAASWARNLASTRVANFDINGNLIDIQSLAASTGKFFASDLDPRSTDEYMIGTSRQLSPAWSGRLTARYRKSYNFWEDTNNDARRFANAPDDISHDLYIPNLSTLQQGIGGSSYVIAELDNAFSKYYEVAAETEYRSQKFSVRGSYVWSHYYGNFDQDNTNGDPISNDFATFIGSSNLADGPGRQIWDMKYGNLHGDRRHQVKVYGFYNLNWNASVGAFAIYQSGQPWESWDVEVYRSMTSSTSNTIRFSEPAGSHTSDSHYQLDLNYTQNFRLGDRFNLQLRGDVFNVFDKQTGYAIQPNVHVAAYGQPTAYFAPRRIQLAVRFQF
jgi:carboxypeptidase family protein